MDASLWIRLRILYAFSSGVSAGYQNGCFLSFFRNPFFCFSTDPLLSVVSYLVYFFCIFERRLD